MWSIKQYNLHGQPFQDVDLPSHGLKLFVKRSVFRFLFFYFLSFSVVWNLQIFGRRWQYKSGEAAFCTFRRRWLFVLLSHDLFIFSSETKHLIWLFLCLNILKKTKIDCQTISYSLFYGFLWRKDRRLIIHRDARGSWGLPPPAEARFILNSN